MIKFRSLEEREVKLNPRKKEDVNVKKAFALNPIATVMHLEVSALQTVAVLGAKTLL